ncbi:MAG: NADP-dependent oxidoreductase [Candidatus Freyarchaeum deiterrae]
MKAVQIKEYGHIDVIEIKEVDKPRPAKDQVQIEVHASSINPVDWKIREGHLVQMFPAQLPITLGRDLAGVITELGKEVTNTRVGDKVYGQAGVWGGGSGALAEYATTPAGTVAKMPKNLSFTEAAAIVLVGVSAVQTLIEDMKLKRKQKILIHGGAGGIGTIAIQIAKNIGAYVTTTATGNGIEYVKQLGADEVIDYKTQAFDEKVSGYDAVYDTVGGETYTRSFKVLKKGGIIVSMLEPPNANLMKQYGVTAILRMTQITTKRLDVLRKFVEDGVVKVHIEKTYPLSQIKEAFKAKETGDVLGKIAIEIKK